MHTRALIGGLIAWAWLGRARVAAACPDCAPVRAARAAIEEDPAFWSYMLWTAAPFIVLGLVAAAVHHTGHAPRGRIVS